MPTDYGLNNKDIVAQERDAAYDLLDTHSPLYLRGPFVGIALSTHNNYIH